MTKRSPRVDFEQLLAHADWVRAVAHRLVVDAAAADDVVQSTWLAALRRPPRSAGNLRAWLRAVISNEARQAGRAQGRRARRESVVARPEAQPSLDEVAEKAALQRDVVNHVLALDEPFRSVVLLRFFENQTPPQIAERLDVPLKTVHSRLQRAFEKLRGKLDGEYGDQRSWCLALIPLALEGKQLPAAVGATSLATAGVWIVNANLKIGLVALLAALGGFGLWRATTASGAAAEVAVPPLTQELRSGLAPTTPQAELASAPRDTVVERSVASEAPVTTPEATTAEVAAEMRIKGRVVNLSGAPLSGLTVINASIDDAPLGVTDATGAFDVELATGELALWNSRYARPCLAIEDESWLTLRMSCVRTTNQLSEHIVVAAPVTRLAGRVQDPSGAPIADARITLGSQSEAFYGFPFTLDTTTFVDFKATSGPDGTFEFARFPKADGLRMHIFAEGYIGASVMLDEEEWPLVLELTPVGESRQRSIEGIVLDERGFAIEGAQVQLAEERIETDESGFFRLPVGHLADGTPLCAAKTGRLPALVPNFAAYLEQNSGLIELVLGGEPLKISGRVVGSDGEACEDWIVSLVDETEISQFRVPIDSAEALVRGRKRTVKTAADGSFELDGLLERAYTVQAYNPSTLMRTEQRVEAGATGLTLRVETELLDEISGTVVSRDGEPLANIRVTVALDTIKTSIGSSSISGAEWTTDETGEFRFTSVPSQHAYLRFNGETVLPGSYALVEDIERGTLDEIEVVAVRRCHVRLELAGNQDAKYAEFLDADGTRLQVNKFEAHGMSAFPAAKLKDGKSEMVSVSELATTLVLRGSDGELGRHTIALAAEGVNLLRL